MTRSQLSIGLLRLLLSLEVQSTCGVTLENCRQSNKYLRDNALHLHEKDRFCTETGLVATKV